MYLPCNVLSWTYLHVPPKDSIKNILMTIVKAAHMKNRECIQGVAKAYTPETVCLHVFILFRWNHTLQHTQTGCLPAPCRKPIRQLCGQDASGRCNIPSAQPSGDHPSSGYRRYTKTLFSFHWHRRGFQTTLSKSLSISPPWRFH